MALSVVRVVALCDDDLLVRSKAQIGKAPPRYQSGNEGTDNVASVNTVGIISRQSVSTRLAATQLGVGKSPMVLSTVLELADLPRAVLHRNLGTYIYAERSHGGGAS